MRKLDISAISTTNAMPVKSGIWEHIQLAYQESIAELGKGLFGSQYDPTKVYILNGCKNTGSGSSYDISAGSVFFNGEVFLVDAATFTISGSNVARAAIETTFYSGVQADGVEFTDGVSRNIHQIRKAAYGPGLAGSGIGDYANAIDIKYMPQGGIGQTIEWKIPSGVIADYFNGSGVGIHALTLGWEIDDEGVFIVGYQPSDSIFGAVDNTGGERTHTLTADEIPELQVVIPTTGYVDINGGANKLVGHANEPLAADITFNVNSGGGDPHNNLPPYKVKLKITRVA